MEHPATDSLARDIGMLPAFFPFCKAAESWYSASTLFPANIPAALRVPLHVGFELLGYVAGSLLYLYLRKKQTDILSTSARTTVLAAAAVGAALGSRLLSLLEDPAQLRWRDLLLLDQGKTIVGGILGAWIAVEIIKRRNDIRARTGDLFVLPLALGTMIGRIGCFLAGTSDRTFGRAASLPWAIDFGDGIRRHPLQLYEIAAVAMIAVAITRIPPALLESGDRFRLYVFSYLALRLGLEFLKDSPRFAGLTAIQWAALAGALCCLPQVAAVLRRALATAEPRTA